MNPSQTGLLPYQMLLLRGPVHPEFFKIAARRQVQHADYEFESWLYNGGHVLRFEHGGATVTEVVTDQPDELPDRGLINSLPCSGERDHEETVAERITLVTSMQTETLSDHLYLSSYDEMLEHSRQPDCLVTRWHDKGQHPSISILEFQRYSAEVHVQSYHLQGDSSLILRTQTIFQVGVEDD